MKEQNSPEGPKRTVYPMQIDSSQQDALVGTITSSESLVTSHLHFCFYPFHVCLHCTSTLYNFVAVREQFGLQRDLNIM